MTQTIEVRKKDDHHIMKFEGNDTEYPVPTNAIDKLDDDLIPEDDEVLRFKGEYGGSKHTKTFTIEEIIKAPGNDLDQEETRQNEATNTVLPHDDRSHHEIAGEQQQTRAQKNQKDIKSKMAAITLGMEYGSIQDAPEEEVREKFSHEDEEIINQLLEA